MTIFVTNQQTFEWEIPDELVSLDLPLQDLIDEYFNPDDISVDQVTDDYYELWED